MAQRSKRYRAIKEYLTSGKTYSIEEAIQILRQSQTKFDSTVELHAKLGIDVKKSEQAVRGTVQLPHGTGKQKRIIAFVSADEEGEAKAAGADIIGTPDVIQQIKQSEKIDFDLAVATPQMMKQLSPIARLLGQKGLMPNPKTETIGTDVKKMITAVKQGKVSFKNDGGGNIHLVIGKLSFSDVQLAENIRAAITAFRRVKPASAKGIYLRSLSVCATMGPGVPLATAA